MPRVRAAKVDRTAVTLAKIRAAAREIFYDKGLDDASVEEIAQKSGLSRATIYLYFRSKEDMLLDMLQEDVSYHTRKYDSLAAMKPVSKAAIKRWLAEYAEAVNELRPRVNLFFTAAARKSNLHVNAIEHRETIIATLGARFKGFDLEALAPAERVAQRVKCYMMILLIEQVPATFSTTPAAPKLENGLDVLASVLLHFLRTGELRSE